MKKVIITGASGYLGSIVTEHLIKNDFDCIKLVRNPQGSNSYKYELSIPIENETVFINADYLIHLAYDFSANKSWTNTFKVNVEGSINLFRIAAKYKVKIIFISSISSFENSKSNYGKSKFLIEQKLQEYGGENYIIKPGLIYGEEIGGIFEIVFNLAKLPIVPFVNIKNNFYLVNYKDILHLIDSIVDNQQLKNRNKPIIAANTKPYNLKQLFWLMDAKIFFALPWKAIWVILRCMELIGVNLRTGSDSLINLINQDANPDFSTMLTTKIVFSDFDVAWIKKWK